MTLAPKLEIQTIEYYDWHKVKEYLEGEYGARFETGSRDGEEFRSFWHFITDKFEVSNGGFVDFSRINEDDCKKDWQKPLLHLVQSFVGDKQVMTSW